MNVLARVGAFTAALVAVGGTAAAVGATVGPLEEPAPSSHAAHPDEEGHGADHAPGAASGAAPEQDTPAGLQVAERGYRLDLLGGAYAPSSARELRFRVLDEQGRPVTRFATQHGKRLHLIVVRRDLASFQHVHPDMAPDGTWSAVVDLDEAGSYRAFADFRPEGADEGLTLGSDLSVDGAYAAQPLPAPASVATVGPYEVRLTGRLVPGRTSRLTLTVSRDGVPVTDLQPYLEAYGHLVVLRDGDLAYLHVHPDGAPGDGRTEPGPEVSFLAEVPTAGSYRMFLDFRHEDEVRTAAFTAVAGPDDGDAHDADADEPAHDAAHTH